MVSVSRTISLSDSRSQSYPRLLELATKGQLRMKRLASSHRRIFGATVVIGALFTGSVAGASIAAADDGPPEPGQNQMQGPNSGPPEPGQNQFQGPGQTPSPKKPAPKAGFWLGPFWIATDS